MKTMDQMRNKDTLGDLVRIWIKTVFKELFNPDLSEVTQLKSLLFLFMDNLPDKSKEKQFNNLHDKVCIETRDMLKKEDLNESTLRLYIGVMEGVLDKTAKNRSDFYAGRVNYEVLDFMAILKEEKTRVSIYSLINAALPLIPDEKLNPSLVEYFKYLLNIALNYPAGHKSFTELLFKIAKTQHEGLKHQVTLILVSCLEKGLIKDNIVPLLNMIFDTDKKLIQVNAELDLKTYLFERYQHRIKAFDPQKEHLL